MEIFILFIGDVWTSIATSTPFFIFKVLAFLYTVLLFVGIILTMYAHGIRGDFRKQFQGADIPWTKKKVQRTWRDIRNRVSRNTVAQFKVAILEADYFLNDYMGTSGYSGDNLTEKLSYFDESVFSRIETVRAAHEVRNKIVQDENFTITREQTIKILDDFEAFINDLDIL